MRSIWGVMGLRKTRGRAAKPITKAFCLRDRSPQSSTPTTAEAVVCVRSEVCAVGEFLLADKTDDCGRDENRGGRLKGQDYVLMGIGDRSQTGDEQSPTVVGDIIQSESLRFHRLRAVASSWMTNIAREKEKTAMIPPDAEDLSNLSKSSAPWKTSEEVFWAETSSARPRPQRASLACGSATWMLPRLFTSLPVFPRDFIFRMNLGKMKYAGKKARLNARTQYKMRIMVALSSSINMSPWRI